MLVARGKDHVIIRLIYLGFNLRMYHVSCTYESYRILFHLMIEFQSKWVDNCPSRS